MATAVSENEIIIEVDDPSNAKVVFKPTMESLRGAFDVRRDAYLTRARGLAALQKIPGERIALDVKTGVGRHFDPMEDQLDLLDHVNAVERASGLGAGRNHPKRPRVWRGVHVPTWLYWMWRMVTGGAQIDGPDGQPSVAPQARLIQGQFPSQLPKGEQREFHRTVVEPDDATKVVEPASPAGERVRG